MRCTVRPEKEFRIAASDRLPQSVTVFRFLRQRLTVVMRLSRHGIDREEEVVGGDGTGYVSGQILHARDRFCGSGVFQNYPEVRKVGCELSEVSEEVFLGV